MSPDRFRSRLDAEVAEPSTSRGLAEAVARDLGEGRQLLRRRRLTAAVGGVAVACVAATLLAGVGDADRAVDPAGGGGTVQSTCMDQNSFDAARRALGPDPVVKVVSTNPAYTLAVLESANGRYWAECALSGRGTAEVSAAVGVYDSTERTRGWSFGARSGCPELDDGEHADECRRFSLQAVDRLPDTVAAVSFEINDGEETTVEVVDGYVVLNYLGDLPKSVHVDRSGIADWRPLHQVTYLNRHGRPIAASRFDEGGTGLQKQAVDGLPGLQSVPSLRGSVPIGYR